ncbi:MAG: hypothetical protein ABI836_02250 [Gemmatimonadota bacterium]
MKYRMLAQSLFSAAVVALAGCTGNGAAAPGNGSTVRFNPPNSSFANSLGINGPVTAVQAQQIAALAAQGTAGSVEQEDQDGTQVFGVPVTATPSGDKDVKVRISDGAVTQIDDGGPDGPGSESGSEN